MRRFALAPDRLAGGRVTFDREETHHLARVLRLRPGDVVTVIDGRGRDYTVRIDTLGDAATGTVVGAGAAARESRLRITLIHGVPKGDGMETVVRAATELGVVRVIPAVTERTVVRLDGTRALERTRRWQRVAKEAAKQCGRAVIPQVEPACPLRECLAAAADGDLRLCLWEGETQPLGRVLAGVARPPSSVVVLVGPEGGLAPHEVDVIREHGFTPVGLGPRILRTGTAGLAAVAIVQFVLGDLGA